MTKGVVTGADVHYEELIIFTKMSVKKELQLCFHSLFFISQTQTKVTGDKWTEFVLLLLLLLLKGQNVCGFTGGERKGTEAGS